MSEKHTSLPWVVGDSSVRADGADGKPIFFVDVPRWRDECEANAALIVAAVNSYPSRQRLVRILEALLETNALKNNNSEHVMGLCRDARLALAEIGEKP